MNVKTTLDGFPLGDDILNPPSVRYERTFRQDGTGGPGLKHTLIVTAHDQDGKEESATSIWEDDA